MMLSQITIFAVLTACAVAQNISIATYFDINNISQSDRNSWCIGQETVCDTLCSGETKTNTCNNINLNFSCLCTANSSTPGLQFYNNTIPTLECHAAFGRCILAHPNDLTGQTACKTKIDDTCGNIDSTNMTFGGSASSTSSSASSTTSGSKTSNTASASGSSASASSTSKSAAVALLGAGQQYGLGALAAGAMAAFGFLL